MSLVLLGYTDDKSQVRFHKALKSFGITTLYANGKLRLFIRGDHWIFADVRQILVNGLITDRHGLSNLKLLHVDY